MILYSKSRFKKGIIWLSVKRCLYYNSIDALQQLLGSRYKKREKHDKEGKETYNRISCQITKMSDKISYMTNGIKYYFVEVTCSDGIQYGIQAYGEEAEHLYKEAHKYFDIWKIYKEEQNFMFRTNDWSHTCENNISTNWWTSLGSI